MTVKGDIVVLIPAYKPSQRLVDVISHIRSSSDISIVVVDDGSGPDYSTYFEKACAFPGVLLLRNAVNLGKGAALKNGINQLLVRNEPTVGIITADADGQHSVADILAVADTLRRKPGALVLGARAFDKDVPLRSRFGNSVSRIVYRIILGIKLRDTQTGLRGIPAALAAKFLQIRSNRYEFETEQLAAAAEQHVPIEEVTIETIYEDGNASSHFNPMLDSLRIYFVVLRYGAASIVTSIVDFAAFIAILPLTQSVIAANLGARSIALIVQFLLVRGFVFRSKASVSRFVFFVAYVMVMGMASGVLQEWLTETTAIGTFLSKLIIESAIFVFNFLFLRSVLFGVRKNEQ